MVDGGSIDLPRVVPVRASGIFHGDGWMGVKMRDASVVEGRRRAADVRRPGRPAAAARRVRGDLGARGALSAALGTAIVASITQRSPFHGGATRAGG